eukprot:9467881-Pyramimonas_sp.AAC.1
MSWWNRLTVRCWWYTTDLQHGPVPDLRVLRQPHVDRVQRDVRRWDAGPHGLLHVLAGLPGRRQFVRPPAEARGGSGLVRCGLTDE